MCLKFFFEKVNFEKKVSRRQQKHANLPRIQRVKALFLSNKDIAIGLNKIITKQYIQNKIIYYDIGLSYTNPINRNPIK